MGSSTPEQLKNLHVLIVEDSHTVCTLEGKFLQELGFQNVDIAHDGDEGAKKLEDKKYDIVFLDWNMPGMSGYALLQKARQDPKFQHSVFVMVTAQTGQRHITEAIKAGANCYIKKPFDKTAMSRVVDEATAYLAHVKATAK